MFFSVFLSHPNYSFLFIMLLLSTYNPAVICCHSICTAEKKTLLNCQHVFNFIKDDNLIISCTDRITTATGKSEIFSCHSITLTATSMLQSWVAQLTLSCFLVSCFERIWNLLSYSSLEQRLLFELVVECQCSCDKFTGDDWFWG